ncbi:MAG: DUF393 domain-containing protein [Acetobacteraceae bacterium]|nr:DUF393 domain-containing protein [Acetobacteraceae bacterium]
MEPAVTSTPENFILYDGECPVCSRYVAYSRLRQSRPGIIPINARQRPDLVRRYRDQGIEINDTMVVQLAGQRPLTGGDALVFPNAVSDADGVLTRGIVRYITPHILVRAYPALVAARKLLLRLLRRGLIS